MFAFLTVLVCLGLFIAGLVSFLRATRAKTSKAPGCGMLIGAPLLLVLAAGMWPSTSRSTLVTSNTTSGASAPESGELSPGQMLNVIEGRDRNDPEIPQTLERLDTVCPEGKARVADLVVNFQKLARENAGRSLSIPEAIDQMYKAQEGPAQEGGLSCVETSAALLTLMEKGL